MLQMVCLSLFTYLSKTPLEFLAFKPDTALCNAGLRGSQHLK